MDDHMGRTRCIFSGMCIFRFAVNHAKCSNFFSEKREMEEKRLSFVIESCNGKM